MVAIIRVTDPDGEAMAILADQIVMVEASGDIHNGSSITIQHRYSAPVECLESVENVIHVWSEAIRAPLWWVNKETGRAENVDFDP